MPLPTPNLDDRNFDQLMAEARRQMKLSCPGWTDQTPGDPGIVLLELFAYLTELMLYRLNRVPEKAYIQFLNLIGVRLQPPAAARVKLRFSRARADGQPLEIPSGVRVTTGRAGGGSEPPVFVTVEKCTIPAGAQDGDEVLAYHCEGVEAEPAGQGAGLPGLSITARRPPIIAPTGDGLDLLVGVEATSDELGARAAGAIPYAGKTYRIWREVENFANLDPTDPFVYVADRMTGTLIFAPAARMPAPDGGLEDTARALAAVPPAGREIRLWYRRGGGAEGNVAADTLTTLKSALPGVRVTNPNPATGGRAAETLDNALVRGPQQMHALQRAVTARDFELLAQSSSRAVARAKALAPAGLWTYAAPGTVEVLLVPYLPEETFGPGQVTGAALHQYDTEEARAAIQAALDERRPIGIDCRVKWARYKTVRVTARIVVRREEDPAAVRQRVLKRLYQTVSPLPTSVNATGWPFGQALRVSDIYDILLKEPGVRWADQVRLWVDEVPDKDVTSIVRDAFQPHAWYAASGSILFRSLNDGDGWETAGRFPDEAIAAVRVHPRRAGLVAVLTHPAGSRGESRLHVSRDCGETWGAMPFSFAFDVEDMAWTLREEEPVLLLAADTGLLELRPGPEGAPVPVLVDPSLQNQGFYGVAVAYDVRGGVSVAVAAQNMGGVYLSSQGSMTKTFRPIGLKGQDVRMLAVQYAGPRAFLWAGTASAGGEDPGQGCSSWELRGAEDPPEGWRAFGQGWNGGTAHDLAFVGTSVLAASHRSGVMQLDPNAAGAAWRAASVNGGLPMRDRKNFQPVVTVAADWDRAGPWVMAGCRQEATDAPAGIYRSHDGGATFQYGSTREFLEKVTLPETWLFVSGEHGVSVVRADEAE